MSLQLYKKKRSFSKTPEPKGKRKSAAGRGLKFVIQKHDASHLHYDFRLEMEGVLKSWAVPKGPSMNPEDKRLAMMVEDHPYEYRTFEGTIPEGNYGAGTVMVWDQGTYEALNFEEESIKEQEKKLLAELKKGDVKIVLHGEKIKGAFALVKMKGRGENSWLLIKKKDEEVLKSDITKKDKSVKTERSLTEIAAASGGTVKKAAPQKKKKSAPPKLIDKKTSAAVKKKALNKK